MLSRQCGMGRGGGGGQADAQSAAATASSDRGLAEERTEKRTLQSRQITSRARA